MGQILPLGTSLVLPWLHTGMSNPLPAAFQAVLLLTRKAPNTFPSHGGVVGPQPGSTDFPNWKKKKGCGKEGPGMGMHFPCFLFGAGLIQQRSPNGKRQSEHVLCAGPGASRRAGCNWGKLGEFLAGPEGVERSKAPRARVGAPGMLQAWGTRHWGVVFWQRLTPAQRLRWAQCQLGFQVGFLHLVGADPGMQILQRGEGPGAAEVANLEQEPVPLWYWLLHCPATPCRLLAGENCSRWDLWRSAGTGITSLGGERIPDPGGHVPLPQLFLLVALESAQWE